MFEQYESYNPLAAYLRLQTILCLLVVVLIVWLMWPEKYHSYEPLSMDLSPTNGGVKQHLRM